MKVDIYARLNKKRDKKNVIIYLFQACAYFSNGFFLCKLMYVFVCNKKHFVDSRVFRKKKCNKEKCYTHKNVFLFYCFSPRQRTNNGLK